MIWNLIELGTVTSTNDEAIARARAGAPHGTVLVAAEQTRGRGRQGRVWHSPCGENLYLSAILRLDLAPAAAPPVTLACGIATVETVNALVPGASIKYPNDVLLNGKKVAGILTESSTRGDHLEAVVVGIGLNLNGTEFPPEIAGLATSLRVEGGRPVDPLAVRSALLAQLETWIGRFLSGGREAIVQAFNVRTAGAKIT